MRPRDFFFAMFTLTVAAGCGDKAAGTRADDDRRQIASLLADLEDLPARPSEFNARFVGEAPSARARQKYFGTMCRLSGPPTVNGDTATAKIRIQRVNTGASLSDVTWEFAKVGDTWKIKSAPLP